MYKEENCNSKKRQTKVVSKVAWVRLSMMALVKILFAACAGSGTVAILMEDDILQQRMMTLSLEVKQIFF